MEILCLIQLLHLFEDNYLDVTKYHDLIVYHLYTARKMVSPMKLRKYIEDFVSAGFNPFSAQLSPTSKVMMKSIIARCDSVIPKP